MKEPVCEQCGGPISVQLVCVRRELLLGCSHNQVGLTFEGRRFRVTHKLEGHLFLCEGCAENFDVNNFAKMKVERPEFLW